MDDPGGTGAPVTTDRGSAVPVERHRGAAGEASHQAVGGAGHGVNIDEHDGDARDGRRRAVGTHTYPPIATTTDGRRRATITSDATKAATRPATAPRFATSERGSRRRDAATGQQRGRHPLPRQQLGVETPA